MNSVVFSTNVRGFAYLKATVDSTLCAGFGHSDSLKDQVDVI